MDCATGETAAACEIFESAARKIDQSHCNLSTCSKILFCCNLRAKKTQGLAMPLQPIFEEPMSSLWTDLDQCHLRKRFMERARTAQDLKACKTTR